MFETKSDQDTNTNTITSSSRSGSAESSRGSSASEGYVLSIASKNSMAPQEAPILSTTDTAWPSALEMSRKQSQYNLDQHHQHHPLEIQKSFLPIEILGSQIGDSVSSRLPPQEFSKLVSTLETCKH